MSARPTHATERARWRAVVERDVRADGRFFYGVRTTKVFCRPACGSRLPRRENVTFFESAAAARAAGYRACKRCEPEANKDEREAATLLRAACEMLEAEGERAASADVARALGFSAAYFQRFFKRHLGVTPQEYRRRALAGRAHASLPEKKTVTDAIYDAGYGASSRFYEAAARELGMAPSRAAKGAPGETIEYAIARCSLGEILVAWTERGVCAVELGASTPPLVRGLRKRFEKASVKEGPERAWVHALVRAADMGSAANVPLDLSITAFQARVYRALRRIPPGETRTYEEVARAIGRPTAARAVARACATNPAAIAVPCHRVVRADGGLAGYRWGTKRKRALLDAERALFGVKR